MSCTILCSRYRRKGSSALGLDFHKQGVSWEDSEVTNKKKKKGGDGKKAADRYYSTVSRQLLKAAPALPALPASFDGSDGTSSAIFLPLCDDEADNKEGEKGTGSSWVWQRKNSATSCLMCHYSADPF